MPAIAPPGRNLKNLVLNTKASPLCKPRSGSPHRSFPTVSSRSVASQPQSCRLDHPLNDRHLALVQFEVDNLPRFRFPVSRPVSSFSTSCLNCSFGICRARCNQVAPRKGPILFVTLTILRRVRFALKIV